MIGSVIGNYKILEQLGEGGMGKVYLAVDLMLDRKVAIKALRPEIAGQAEVMERFRAEAATLAKLNHTNIATLYALLRHGNGFFMVMEFVRGHTLDKVMKEVGAMRCEEAIPLILQVLDGLDHAHSFGILHRDIKPANIMISDAGIVKVTDFGIARVLGAARLTRQGTVVGTIEYMSPERIQGHETDVRCDIYSVGVLLYEMLSGRLPFVSDSDFELMIAHVHAPPPPLRQVAPRVPEAVERVVMCALNKRLEGRFANVGVFREALIAAAEEVMPPSPKGTRPSPRLPLTRLAAVPAAGAPQPPDARRALWKLPTAISATVLVVLAAMAAWFTTRVAKPPVQVASVIENQPARQPALPPPQSSIADAEVGRLLAPTPVPDSTGNGNAKTIRPPSAASGSGSLPAPAPARPKEPGTDAEAHPLTPGRAGKTPLAPAPARSGPPLTASEIVAALTRGTPSESIEQAVSARGVNFHLTPQIAKEIEAAGGKPALIGLVATRAAAVAPPPSPPPAKPAPASVNVAAPPPPSAGVPATPPPPTVSAVPGSKIPAGSRVFVSAMRDDLKGFLSAEIVKQKVPVVLVDSEATAEYILVGTATQADTNKWFHNIYGSKEKATGAFQLLRVRDKTAVWAGQAGDRSFLFGRIAGGGKATLAERLIRKMAYELFPPE